MGLMKFYKGDTIIATNVDNNDSKVFTCPSDNMCTKLLTRYLVQQLEMPLGKFVFVKQN